MNFRPLRRPFQITLALFSALTLGSGMGQAQNSAKAQTTKLQVVTTLLPITNFTKAVAGDRAQVTPLMPTNVGPHDYQAKPEDAKALAKANVLVINGLEIEGFLEGLIQNAGNKNLKLIDSSKGIPTIKEGALHGFVPDPSAAYAGEGHDHGEFNPHIWLDPKRAIMQVENIRDGLSAADPQGKSLYTQNAAAYIQKLKTLDTETSSALKPYAGKTFVTFHDFAPYFAQSYGLKAEFLVDVPDENPSPADVKRVMSAVQKSGLKTLLTELQVGDGNPFEALAKDLKVNISVFDPIETGPAEATNPDFYLTVMRQNVKNLKSAFSGKPVSSLGSPVQLPVAFSLDPLVLVSR